ncbi:EndoU domain-containing protein [uncultured Tenacibaculum sp.]|uniref:EndoU domain-containing protein n=1 Tax=uncultured Tenacibaculum sp. TaxID=174713 RepID=UPI00260CA479|nr:EndoU domain-containing protein [uncultured Tenacibaculum sp.]
MHAHIYGKKHFKHKTNFKDLVVFSDVTQNKIATELPSETLYFEVEKGYDDADKWFIHLNSTLSGEYGDFYTQENPTPVGEIKKIQYDTDNDISALNDFLIDGALPYYKINERFYVKIENAALLDEVFVGKQPKSNQKSIEYDAFTTVFISEDGAQLLQAYEAIQQVNAHEVVIFIERNSGTNAFGTVFRIKQGANVKALIETNRTRIAEIARAYGVDVLANELSTMIAEELKKQKESKFYFMLPSGGGRIIRWTANATLGTVSEIFKEVSSGIEGFKLGDDYWKTEVDGKENPKYNPLLPKLNFNEGFSSEELASKIYKERIVPLEIPIVDFAKELNEHWLFKKIVPFKSERILKLFQNIPSILKEFFDGVKNKLQNSYDFVNGLLVGLLNSIVDFFKSIFDILAILVDVLNGIIQSAKFFEKPGHYFSMLVEGFENLIDLVLNTFTLKNLKAWVQFLIYLPVATAQVLVGLYTKASNTSVTIDPGALGYYTGFLVGFIASEVVQFIATGGTANIAKATRAVLKSYKELAKVVVKKTVQTTELTVEVVLAMYRKLDEFVKNIPKHLDDLKTWVKEFVAGLQAKALVIDSVTYTLVDPLSIFANSLFKLFKVNAWKKLNNIGVSMLKNEEGLYTFYYNDKKLKEGLTQGQAEEFLKELFVKSKDKPDDVVKKYLDELVELTKLKSLRKAALEKYFNKFDVNLFNHISGDVAVETIKIVFREISYVGTFGQGGHWINKFLEIISITHPPGISNVTNLLDDVPFKARIKVKSLRGKVFSKRAESSMFPKNWNEQRVKEEIAFVYENTFIKGVNKRPSQHADKFDKFEGLSTSGFKIRIEIDKSGNIMNAYPII